MTFLGLEDLQWIRLATIVFAGTFFLGTYSALKLRRKTGRPYILSLVVFGWALQTFGLYARGLEYGGCPLANKFELVQFMVWSAIALYIFIGPAFRVSLLGVFTSAFATIFSILSLSVTSWDNLNRTPIFGDNPWIEMHAATALFSYGVFGILALTSAMYLIQSRNLKKKKIGGLFPYLPSIVELSNINMRLAWMGFAILSVSLGIGSFYWAKNLDSVDFVKLSATVIVWLAYGILAILRASQTLTSKRYSWSSIILFALALLSLGAVQDKEPKTLSTIVELDR
ncbi:cytochrome c biogenesis protein [Puniceicoccaceae bacterium K14]|nr:cytochrome c biogenesis protein [Puniceicoccaceae bacterium K14]